MNYGTNKTFGYQNTLNQIATHYEFGTNPTNFESTTKSKFRNNSNDRNPVFATNKVKDYQETHHFHFGGEGVPKMTTTWSNFSR